MGSRDEVVAELWRDVITPNSDLERVRRLPAAERLLEAGAHPADLTRLLQLVAYEAVFATLYAITQPERQGFLGLHEDLLAGDPTGREGQDFLSG